MEVHKRIETIRNKWYSRLDAQEPDDWITVNGTHIPIDVQGNMQGKVADKIRHVSPQLREHFNKENAKVEKLTKGRIGKVQSIEMANGQILERYSMKEMKDIIKWAKDSGQMDSDFQISILYSDGAIDSYGEGDDTSKIKLSGIKGVIYDNPSTIGYAGTGVKIENYNETLAGEKRTRYGTSEEEDDWRIDFE